MTWTIRPRSDFGALSAICQGSGPKLVLVHGVGLRAEAWNRQLDALSERFEVIAVDMPGHGESPLPGPLSAIQDYTDLVAGQIPEPVMIVGHSMGAMIALDLAIRYPSRVRGVAALNAVYQRSPEARDAVMARASSLDGRSPPDPSEPLLRWFGGGDSEEKSACSNWLISTDPAAYKRAYSAFARSDVPSPSGLEAMKCPALFMTGSQEPNSTADMSRAMAAVAPNGKAVIVDGAAHMMPMTHADKVNPILLDFALGVWK